MNWCIINCLAIYITLNCLKTTVANTQVSNGKTTVANTQVSSGTSVSFVKPWISNIIAKGMAEYYPFGVNKSSLCTKHGQLIELYSHNYTIWALRMIDSYGRSPSGIIYGNLYDFGHFDECIETQALNNTIRGQYTMMTLQFWPVDEPLEFENYNDTERVDMETLFQERTYWELVENSKNVWDKRLKERIKERNKITWSICVPTSCSVQDIQHSVSQTLMPYLNNYGFRASLSITESFKYNYSDKHWTLGAIMFLALLWSLILFEIAVSLYHWFFIDDSTKYSTRFERMVKHFSIVYNVKELLSKTNDTVSVISGIKVVSMICIVFGHRMLLTRFSPIYNTLHNEIGIGKLANTYYNNGIIIVDTFLVVTGFLSFNKMLKAIEKYDYFNPLRYLYRRYMRLTPAYGFVIGVVIWILPMLDTGPRSSSLAWNSTDCTWSWWTHLSYVNNYVHCSSQCLIPSWYLAADMQLYIFCTIIAFLVWRVSRFFGLSMLALSLLLSCVVPAVILYVKGYVGVTLMVFSDFTTYFNDHEFVETYLQTHFRASPYIIGMLAACLYRKIQTTNIMEIKRKYKYLMVFLQLVHVLLMNVAVLSAWWFYDQDEASFASITYAVLHRVAWAIPVAWIIVMHSSNISAPFQKLLGHPIFGLLNEVGYGVLLVHSPIQLYLISKNRTPVYVDWLTSIWMAAGDVVISYGVAIVLHVLIEAPFNNLFLS